jgi:hypothetical protein
MLELDAAQKVFRDLSIGYRAEVASRLQFTAQRQKKLTDTDVMTHVLGYDVGDNSEIPCVLYTDVASETRLILEPYLNHANKIIDELITDSQYKFLIMSTDWCGASRHFRHVHTLIQKEPLRCETLSITIPLYLDPNYTDHHKFRWHYQPMLYPKIVYADHTRMEKIQREYTAIEISKTEFSSLKFDSSRCIHYIDNTPDLYLWFVCDGVTWKNSTNIIKGVHVELHGNIV